MDKLTPRQALKKILAIQEKQKKYQEDCMKKISEIRSKCQHEWKYVSDPSGNNDGGYSCHCGEWTKKP
jgi:hypothetical protein